MTRMNANKDIELVPIVRPNERTLAGKTSTKQINDNGTIPTDEIKTTKPKLVTGTHLNIDMS